jgi:hypothetical protein
VLGSEPQRRFALCLLLLGASSVFADPGFGTLKKRKIELSIRQPAAVRLANTSFAVRGSSTSPAYAPITESLSTTLETELIANEKTLVKKSNPGEADWVLSIRVTSVSLPQPAQRTQTVGNNSTVYIHWAGSLHASYQVLDHAGRSHDAGNVQATYDKELPAGAKQGQGILQRIPGVKKSAPVDVPETPEDLKDILIRDMVKQIAAKLGNTKRVLEVQVATGDDHLNRAADFMEKKLWSRALDEIEKTPAYPKPDQEAYRQYDLGLVYEAISYESAAFKDQSENLSNAQDHYDQALEMNQKEKYFVDTVARIRDATARYKAFQRMQNEDGKASPAPVAVAQNTAPPPAPAAQPAPATQAVKNTPAAPKTVASAKPAPAPKTAPPSAPAQKSAAKALTIQDVIEMFSSGVPQDQIASIIQRSQVQFDPFDKDTAIAVAKARLPVELQNEMRKKVGAPLLGPSTKK